MIHFVQNRIYNKSSTMSSTLQETVKMIMETSLRPIIKLIKYYLSPSISVTSKPFDDSDFELLRSRFNHNAHLLARQIKKIPPKNGQESLSDMLQKFITGVQEIFEIAPKFDYKKVEANGYRSFLKLWTAMLNIAVNEMTEDDHFERLRFVFDTFNKWIPVIQELGKQMNNEVFDPDINFKLAAEAHYSVTREFKELLFSPEFIGMALDPAFKMGLRAWVYLLCSPLFNSFSQAFDCCKSYSTAVKTVIKTTENMTAGKMAEVLRLTDLNVVQTILNLRHIYLRGFWRENKCSVTSHDIMTPSPYLIQITDEGTRIVKNLSNTERPINVRVMTTQSSAEGRKVLMYMHGGGFLGPATGKGLEYGYLKDWVEKIPGLTILNVSYSLAPETMFPTAHQEILDLYFWLTSPSVISILGFKPESIVVGGDSAGGNLSAGVVAALNDIQNLELKNGHNLEILKPLKGLALIFPKLLVRKELYPSHLMFYMDLIVHHRLIVELANAYIPVVKKSKDGNWKIVKDKPENWFHDENYRSLHSPYVSPLAYDKLNELKNVKLGIMGFEFDPFVDESIMLAKKWKGEVDLRITRKHIHGTLILSLVLQSAQDSCDDCCDMIAQLFK